MVPLVLEDALSAGLSSAEVFSGTPEAAALLLRDAVQLRAAPGGAGGGGRGGRRARGGGGAARFVRCRAHPRITAAA